MWSRYKIQFSNDVTGMDSVHTEATLPDKVIVNEGMLPHLQYMQ